MAYTERVPKRVLSGVNLVQAADTSIYKYTVPSGEQFILDAVIVNVTTAAGGTTSAALKVYKGSTLLVTTTGVGISAAIGVTKRDALTPPVRFDAGDVLEIKIGTTATTTGNADVTLEVEPGC